MMSPDTYVGVHPNASADVRMLAVGHGENAARPWHRHRLAERKGKDCDRQPHQYADVQHMNEGRHDGMTTKVLRRKGVDPDVHHVGGVLVVVRGRESLPHGEGEQFKLLEVQTI